MSDRKLPDLSQFSGSETMYRHAFQKKLIYTEGVKYLAEEVGAYWLIDLVASHLHAMLKKAPDEHFTHWELRLDDKHGCTVSAKADSDTEPYVEQYVEFTDFPEDFDFYVVLDSAGWVMMLKSEY